MTTAPAKRPRLALGLDQVLVTVGTPCTISPVGSTETRRALIVGDPSSVGFAAFDAGLVNVDFSSPVNAPRFVLAHGPDAGKSVELSVIEERWGATLRANMGIRHLPRERLAPHVLSDIAAPLPHDLESGGLRRLAGLTFDEVRGSSFRDMFGLFQDDPRLGPSLQSLLFLYGGVGSLAALPKPLAELLPAAHRFRVAAGCAFQGGDAFDAMSLGMQPRAEQVADKKNDKLAYRLSAYLNTHGPALINTMLSPAFNLSRVRKNPSLLDALTQAGSPFRNVPQAPMVSSAACASALVAFSDIASQMLLRYPGHIPPALVLWTAADAALMPDARVLEAFGLGAMMTREKLGIMNQDRAPADRRGVADCLAPFDVDAQGTVVGHAGSGLLVTTLEFALQNFLDVTSIIVGWGQSGETGGKGHFAGVGFGGENALIAALAMAREAHGYGVADFGHLVAHATGTRTNSRTDLTSVYDARLAAARQEGHTGGLFPMTVGAPKAIGDAHSMGETGLKATGEGVHYVLGERTVGIPTLRRLDPELGGAAEHFRLERGPLEGNADGGVLAPTQGFGGYDGAIALRSAHADAIRRYRGADAPWVDAYLERWPELRRERMDREARARRQRGMVRALVDHHCWKA
jgi:3-oxoacyl-[acyl-carrier-protein] synthase II